MSANYIARKTAKYDQKFFFAHFQILMEMGKKYDSYISDILHIDEIHCFNVHIQDFVKGIVFMIAY